MYVYVHTHMNDANGNKCICIRMCVLTFWLQGNDTWHVWRASLRISTLSMPCVLFCVLANSHFCSSNPTSCWENDVFADKIPWNPCVSLYSEELCFSAWSLESTCLLTESLFLGSLISAWIASVSTLNAPPEAVGELHGLDQGVQCRSAGPWVRRKWALWRLDWLDWSDVEETMFYLEGSDFHMFPFLHIYCKPWLRLTICMKYLGKRPRTMWLLVWTPSVTSTKQLKTSFRIALKGYPMLAIY